MYKRDPLSGGGTTTEGTHAIDVPTREKVIVLITDGEDLSGDPVEAAREAAAAKIRVFVDAVGDTTIRPIRSPMLKQIRPDQPPEGPKPETK